MVILDVREKEEFEAEYIPDSISCPLSQINLLAPGILKNLKDNDVVVMCRSGVRSKLALEELKKMDNTAGHRFTSFDGGILRWKEQGKLTAGRGHIFPIMRQVQIVASTMIFIAFLGAHFLHPNFIYLALLVGCGLALSGYTGICPMAFLLQRMPWNNPNKTNCCSSNTSCCK